jgi:amino acid transporter
LILVPSALLAAAGIANWRSNPFVPFTAGGESLAGSIGIGLTVGTPYGSILLLAAVHALLVSASFEALLVVDVFLFVAHYILVFVAGVVLRVREPELPRPFRVPVGTVGLAVVVGVPVLVGAFVMVANGAQYLIYGSLVALTGPVLYALAERRSRRPPSE